MTDQTANPVQTTPKRGKGPLLMGVVLALLGGGGGFYATWSGLVLPPAPEAPVEQRAAASVPLADVSYVELDPIIVSMGSGTERAHLRFRAHIEVPPEFEDEVRQLEPRIVDIMNTYLRALNLNDVEAANALLRIRGQLLRRLQIVTGPERIRDLLVMEFVIN